MKVTDKQITTFTDYAEGIWQYYYYALDDIESSKCMSEINKELKLFDKKLKSICDKYK